MQPIEQALWAAIKGLEQRAQLLSDLAKDRTTERRPILASNFEQEAARVRHHVQTLRDVLVASFGHTRGLP